MKNTTKTFILLHILLILFSFNGIFSKLAADESFLSLKWCIYYALVIFFLGIYAIGWQQVIKRMPLISAYSSKAITVVWGIVWGKLFFDEPITIGRVIGIILIIIGIVTFSISEDYSKELTTL